MAKGSDRPKRGAKDAPRKGKKKICVFCAENIAWVDYKDVNLLRRYMSDRGKIRARRVSGNCTQHQAAVAVAIKTSRELALLPYTTRTVTETRGPRGPRGDRGDRGPRGPRPDADAASESTTSDDAAPATTGEGDE